MKLAVNCKICKRPLTVDCDDDYAAMGDPFKLSKMATCNSCYDMRDERLRYEQYTVNWCNRLLCAPKKNRDQHVQDIREALFKCTRKYAEIVARINRSSRVFWDDELVNLLMDKPEKSGDILRHYRMNFYRDIPPSEPQDDQS